MPSDRRDVVASGTGAYVDFIEPAKGVPTSLRAEIGLIGAVGTGASGAGLVGNTQVSASMEMINKANEPVFRAAAVKERRKSQAANKIQHAENQQKVRSPQDLAAEAELVKMAEDADAEKERESRRRSRVYTARPDTQIGKGHGHGRSRSVASTNPPPAPDPDGDGDDLSGSSTIAPAEPAAASSSADVPAAVPTAASATRPRLRRSTSLGGPAPDAFVPPPPSRLPARKSIVNLKEAAEAESAKQRNDAEAKEERERETIRAGLREREEAVIRRERVLDDGRRSLEKDRAGLELKTAEASREQERKRAELTEREKAVSRTERALNAEERHLDETRAAVELKTAEADRERSRKRAELTEKEEVLSKQAEALAVDRRELEEATAAHTAAVQETTVRLETEEAALEPRMVEVGLEIVELQTMQKADQETKADLDRRRIENAKQVVYVNGWKTRLANEEIAVQERERKADEKASRASNQEKELAKERRLLEEREARLDEDRDGWARQAEEATAQAVAVAVAAEQDKQAAMMREVQDLKEQLAAQKRATADAQRASRDPFQILLPSATIASPPPASGTKLVDRPPLLDAFVHHPQPSAPAGPPSPIQSISSSNSSPVESSASAPPLKRQLGQSPPRTPRTPQNAAANESGLLSPDPSPESSNGPPYERPSAPARGTRSSRSDSHRDSHSRAPTVGAACKHAPPQHTSAVSRRVEVRFDDLESPGRGVRAESDHADEYEHRKNSSVEEEDNSFGSVASSQAARSVEVRTVEHRPADDRLDCLPSSKTARNARAWWDEGGETAEEDGPSVEGSPMRPQASDRDAFDDLLSPVKTSEQPAESLIVSRGIEDPSASDTAEVNEGRVVSRMDHAASYELHSVISAESPIDAAGKDENASADYDDSIVSPQRPLLKSTNEAQTEPPVDVVPSLSRSSTPADDGQTRAHLASEEASMTRSTRPLRSRDQTPSSTTRDVSPVATMSRATPPRNGPLTHPACPSSSRSASTEGGSSPEVTAAPAELPRSPSPQASLAPNRRRTTRSKPEIKAEAAEDASALDDEADDDGDGDAEEHAAEKKLKASRAKGKKAKFAPAGKKAPGASTQPRAKPRAAAAKKEIAEVASSSTSASGRSRREAAQPRPSSSRLKKEPVEGDDQAVDATTMGAGNGEVQEMVRITPAIFALLSSEGDVFPRDSLLGPLPPDASLPACPTPPPPDGKQQLDLVHGRTATMLEGQEDIDGLSLTLFPGEPQSKEDPLVRFTDAIRRTKAIADRGSVDGLEKDLEFKGMRATSLRFKPFQLPDPDNKHNITKLHCITIFEILGLTFLLEARKIHTELLRRVGVDTGLAAPGTKDLTRVRLEKHGKLVMAIRVLMDKRREVDKAAKMIVI